jgi:hypothetical protein
LYRCLIWRPEADIHTTICNCGLRYFPVIPEYTRWTRYRWKVLKTEEKAGIYFFPYFFPAENALPTSFPRS